MSDKRRKDQTFAEKQTEVAAPSESAGFERAWVQFRKLIVFQFKLYLDAFRDLFFSPLSLVACILDLIMQKTGEDSYFERVLKMGRRTELAINLFNQHELEHQDGHSVDSVLREVEDRIRR